MTAPTFRPRPELLPDRIAIIQIAHALRHRGHTVRRVHELMTSCGMPRSARTIRAYLRDWRCHECTVVEAVGLEAVA